MPWLSWFGRSPLFPLPMCRLAKFSLPEEKAPLGHHHVTSIQMDPEINRIFPSELPHKFPKKKNETSRKSWQPMVEPMATNGNHRTKAAHQVEHGPIRVHLCLALSQDLCARAQAEDARLVRLELGMNSTKIPNAGSILY